MMRARFIRRLAVAVVAMAGIVTGTGVSAGELRAYVGAGLRPPVEDLIKTFTASAGDTVVPEYGGSGAQVGRAEETGKGDVFVSGSSTFTDQLQAKGLLVGDAAEIALHGPIIAVRLGKADQITTIHDLAKPGIKVGLGDAKAMALGRTAEEILAKLADGEAIRANVTVRAGMIQQLATYVIEGDVDAAIIGAADAAQNPGKFVVVPIPTDLYKPDHVTAAVLKSSGDAAAARRFVDYLASPAGKAVFVKYGFPALPAR